MSMKKKRNNWSDCADCEKIFRAVTTCHAIRDKPRSSSPASPPPSVHKAVKADSTQISSQVNKEEGKKTGIHVEDRFTDYINSARAKIRTMSNAGEAKKIDRTFSDYINRAKLKLRTVSGKYDASK